MTAEVIASVNDRTATRVRCASTDAVIPICELRTITCQEAKIATIDEQLADPDIYEKDPDKVTDITKTRGELLTQVETLEEEWTIRSEEYEAAIAGF